MLKGKACINCRRRKIKCDGERPCCGQCSRSNGAFEDCEYPGNGPTQTQMLEDRISQLQSRIRQLENREETPAIPLQVPYSNHSPTKLSFQPHAPNMSPHLISQSSLFSQPPASSPTGTSRSSRSSSRSHSGSPPPSPEPPANIQLLLIEIFYQYASRIGFFLNVERFHASFIQSQSIGRHLRPIPSLLNAIYLWGTHLAPSTPEGCDEKGFLREALHHLSKDLSSSHPHRILQGIQAEVLLSYYYLKHGKVLGGHYHANAAISLSLSACLHRIRTPQRSTSPSGSLSSPAQTLGPLPKPADDTEEGERIDSFWAVLILNNTWIAIQESHFMFHDLQAIGVDTPWPLDTFEYQLELLPSVSSGTIQGFLNSTGIEGYSVMALHAKAAVLLEQATVYASNSDDLQLAVSSASSVLDFKLEAVIEQFKTQLPKVEKMDVTPSEADTLLIMEMMTHTATIKLHLPQVEKGELHSRQIVLNAAQAIAVLTNNIQPDSSIRVDPIVGVLWTAACEVFIHELLRANPVFPGNNQQWSSCLHSILSQMGTFAINNVFITFLLNRIHKNYPAVLAMW